MNRLEFLAVMYSLDRMNDMKDHEGVGIVIKKLIKEAESTRKPEPKKDNEE